MNCLMCGVGGQGTVLASRLIADGVMRRGEPVLTAETIGMAQRGGCVVSHVRSGYDVCSPLIPMGQADTIIAFEPGEAARCVPYLKSGATVVVNTKGVMPVTASLGQGYRAEDMLDYLRSLADIRLLEVDGAALCAACGSSKVLNVVLLTAAAVLGALPIDVDELRRAILERTKPAFHAVNLKAMELTTCALKEARP